jgi:UDP-N-acetylmuramoyl-L-alanyl-D-glutamate--2,6-diaminopimelate ligase
MRIALDSKEFKTPLVGRFNAYNAIEALLVPTVLGLDTEKAAKEIEYCTGAPGRLERVNKNDMPGLEHNVFVDYAHTPDALENVLVTLRELSESAGKLTVVFGCGGDRDKGKRPKMARVAESIADRVVVTSDNPRSEDPNAIIEDILQGFQKPEKAVVNPDRKEAIVEAVKSAEPGSIVLIAGKGHETTQEIKGEKLHFDDREAAEEAISQPKKTKTGPGGA